MTTNFLIEVKNQQLEFDFSFHLIKAIQYQNLLRNEKIYEYQLSETVLEGNYVPVGSLEFVFQYLEQEKGILSSSIIPINIPKSLFTKKFLKREVSYQSKKELNLTQATFLKSATQYKSFIDIVDKKENVPEDQYLVSEVIDIQSEWRAFVFQNQLVGIKQYTGDFTLFPDIALIREMIRAYRDAPPAYTLDVGIHEQGTFLIEVHPFISCGLYGFQNYQILPVMFTSAFHWFCRDAKKTPI